MGSEEINIEYNDDIIGLIADVQDDLQRLFYNFHLGPLRFTAKISVHKINNQNNNNNII